MNTYLYGIDVDVDKEEMKKSDSKDKYVQTACIRRTTLLTLDSNPTPFEDEISDESSDIFFVQPDESIESPSGDLTEDETSNDYFKKLSDGIAQPVITRII